MTDRYKGLRGADSPNAKLDDQDVREMRAMRAKDPKRWSYAELSIVFGVCDRSVQRIIKRQSWKHVS